MRLIVFDVDGTLTDTVAVDARCFVQSFDEVCGFKNIDSDWSRYIDATDAGIYRQVFQSRRGRLPSRDETENFRAHLVGVFRAAAADLPFAPLPGAPELLAELTRRPDYRIALATGCWADAARVKMTAAGMDFDRYPAASADDAQARHAILELAIARARESTGETFSGVIYVGDGVWDVEACKRAGIAFLGIAVGGQRDKLIAAGAKHVLANFAEPERFFAAVDEILTS